MDRKIYMQKIKHWEEKIGELQHLATIPRVDLDEEINRQLEMMRQQISIAHHKLYPSRRAS